MSAGSSGSPRHSGYMPGASRGSSQRSSSEYEERCVDPVEDRLPEPKTFRQAHPKDADGRESETIGFIPGSAESPSAPQTCNPCASRSSCRSFVCTVITCGLYRVCQRSGEKSADQAEKVSLRDVNAGETKEEDASDWLGDVRIAGVKVDSQREHLEAETKSSLNAYTPSIHTQPFHQSLHSVRLDDWEGLEEEDVEDVDSLIAKKLLELYSEYQIEELARCTSDSVFLRKSKAIDRLINSVAEEHRLGEREAECRLVRGIIRISTRKSSRRRPRPALQQPRRERTLSDSGNETMRDSDSFSFSNNSRSTFQDDYKSNPNIQISELTSSDKCARDMWRNNGSHNSSPYSPSQTNSSGVPLIRTSVRT